MNWLLCQRKPKEGHKCHRPRRAENMTEKKTRKGKAWETAKLFLLPFAAGGVL